MTGTMNKENLMLPFTLPKGNIENAGLAAVGERPDRSARGLGAVRFPMPA